MKQITINNSNVLFVKLIVALLFTGCDDYNPLTEINEEMTTNMKQIEEAGLENESSLALKNWNGIEDLARGFAMSFMDEKNRDIFKNAMLEADGPERKVDFRNLILSNIENNTSLLPIIVGV